MVLNRQTLLKHKEVFKQLYEAKSKKQILTILGDASLTTLKCLLTLFVDVVHKKIPLDSDVVKKKMKRYERHLRNLATHFNILRKLNTT